MTRSFRVKVVTNPPKYTNLIKALFSISQDQEFLLKRPILICGCHVRGFIGSGFIAVLPVSESPA